jgi:hypothetical protein
MLLPLGDTRLGVRPYKNLDFEVCRKNPKKYALNPKKYGESENVIIILKVNL